MGAELEALAGAVRRLTVHRRDPERFFEERDEIASRLEGLAREQG